MRSGRAKFLVSLGAAACAVLCVLLGVPEGVAEAEGAGLTADARFLVVGEPAILRLMSDEQTGIGGVQVTATYRPESEVSVDEVAGITDSLGVIADWTPKHPGIVTLTASWTGLEGEQSVASNLSVRFASTPWRGVTVLAVAGVILYGGVLLSQLRLRRLD